MSHCESGLSRSIKIQGCVIYDFMKELKKKNMGKFRFNPPPSILYFCLTLTAIPFPLSLFFHFLQTHKLKIVSLDWDCGRLAPGREL